MDPVDSNTDVDSSAVPEETRAADLGEGGDVRGEETPPGGGDSISKETEEEKGKEEIKFEVGAEEEEEPMLNGDAEATAGVAAATTPTTDTGREGEEDRVTTVPTDARGYSQLPTSAGDLPNDKPSSESCLSAVNARKVLIGLTIGLSVAISWVAATQFMKSMYSPTFVAPFFVIWFSTNWMIICYPIYIVGAMVLFKERRTAGLKALLKEDLQIYGTEGMLWWHCLRLTGPFCALWMVTNYMYAAALKLKAPTDVTALFVTNTAFIYAFSWIWLEELLILLPARLFSVGLSILGTVLMMWSDGFKGGNVVGVFLALGSAIGAALYKVLFKRFLGDATYGQVSLFLTVLGVFNMVLLAPVMLALVFTGKEVVELPTLPWAFLCGTSALGIVFNFLVNFGIAITYPLLISLANIVGIPINAVIDTAFRDIDLGALKIVGSLLIIGGFVIMLLPESWQMRVACWTEGSEPCRRQRRPERLPSIQLNEDQVERGEATGQEASNQDMIATA